MPPVPQMCTLRSSSKRSTVRRIAWPSMKQRWPVGGGYCTTFTASGMTVVGHADGWP